MISWWWLLVAIAGTLAVCGGALYYVFVNLPKWAEEYEAEGHEE